MSKKDTNQQLMLLSKMQKERRPLSPVSLSKAVRADVRLVRRHLGKLQEKEMVRNTASGWVLK